MALCVMRKEHTAYKLPVGGSVATGLLKINPDFFSIKTQKTR